ncbi:MAG: HAD-IA family hydrolase [Thermoplasmata archaeon]|nr:MAG: HAD-IA family hydrolase [Thermoplasmata archaeon]
MTSSKAEHKEDNPLEETRKTTSLDDEAEYGAVMLDLFGTLVDFNSVFVDTLNRVLVDHDLVDKADEFRHRWGRFVFLGQAEGDFINVHEDFKHSLVVVLRDLGRDGDLVDYADVVIEAMFEKLRRADLFPEVPSMIASIEDADLPWAVVSNVDEEDLHAILTHHGLRPTVTVSSERVRSYKPEGTIFMTAVQELGVPVERIIHVGDSPIADVAGANDVGIDVLWVNRHGVPYPDDLPRPRWDVPNLSGLPSLLLKG